MKHSRWCGVRLNHRTRKEPELPSARWSRSWQGRGCIEKRAQGAAGPRQGPAVASSTPLAVTGTDPGWGEQELAPARLAAQQSGFQMPE